MNKVLHNTLVMKVTITAGIVLYYALPPGWDAASAISANLLWLWRF